MHHSARFTAGIIAAIALVAVSAAGCTKDKDDKDFKSDTGMVTTTIVAPTTTEQRDEDAGEQDEDTGEESSGASETKIATRNGGEIALAGGFLEKYNELGGAAGALGMPTGPEREAPGGGRVQEFDGGAIYSSPGTGTHVVWGEIRRAWEEQGGPGGELGYPTSDETDITGGKQSEFSGGSIAWVDGQITTTKK